MRVCLTCALMLIPAMALAQGRASSTDQINRALGTDNVGRSNLLPSTGGSARSTQRAEPEGEWGDAPPPPERDLRPVQVPAQPATRETRDIIYLSQLLAGAEHQFAYNRLLARIGTPPTWIRRYNESGDAMQVPVHLVTYKGERFQLARICQPHSADTCFTVVFDFNSGASAVAYYSVGYQGNWALAPYDVGLAEFLESKINAPRFWD